MALPCTMKSYSLNNVQGSPGQERASVRSIRPGPINSATRNDLKLEDKIEVLAFEKKEKKSHISF